MPFRNAAPPGKRVGWRATIRALLVLMVLLAVLGGAIAYSIARRGLSAHAEPSAAEEMVARAMRRWATPASVRDRSNPV
jgi:mono/diheme cytochrome c family protein